MECDGMKWKEKKRVRNRNSEGTFVQQELLHCYQWSKDQHLLLHKYVQK